MWFFLNSHLKICLLIVEREEGREGEREKGLCVRNMGQLPPLHVPTGIKPVSQACALTRNRTCNLLVYRMALPSTEPPGQGTSMCFFCENKRNKYTTILNLNCKYRDNIFYVFCVLYSEHMLFVIRKTSLKRKTSAAAL